MIDYLNDSSTPTNTTIFDDLLFTVVALNRDDDFDASWVMSTSFVQREAVDRHSGRRSFHFSELRHMYGHVHNVPEEDDQGASDPEISKRGSFLRADPGYYRQPEPGEESPQGSILEDGQLLSFSIKQTNDA